MFPPKINSKIYRWNFRHLEIHIFKFKQCESITIPNITGNATVNIKIWCQANADLRNFWIVIL